MRDRLPDVERLGDFQAAFLGDLSGAAPREPVAREAGLRLPPQGTRAGRWAVYAEGYRARLVEALAGDYPAVRRILGASEFEALALRYLKACPPDSFDLGAVGRRLPRFLVSDERGVDLAFLGDLARIERALVDVFVARDPRPLSWDDVQRIGPDRLADLRVSVRGTAVLIRSEWPLLDLLRLRERGEDEAISLELEGRPSTVIVLRKGLAAVCEPIDPDEAAIVEAAGGPEGTSLADLVPDDPEPEAVERAIRAFRRLLDRRVLEHDVGAGETGAAT